MGEFELINNNQLSLFISFASSNRKAKNFKQLCFVKIFHDKMTIKYLLITSRTMPRKNKNNFCNVKIAM